jgi:hypothetical protein
MERGVGWRAGEIGPNPDSTDPASTEEAKPSDVAADHTDVDPFDDGYLLERLIDSVRLTDDNTQRMIASVRSVLDGSESPMEGAEGAGNCAEGAEGPGREESVATRSATQPLVTTESLARPSRRFGLQRKWDYEQ